MVSSRIADVTLLWQALPYRIKIVFYIFGTVSCEMDMDELEYIVIAVFWPIES